jgi:eukaryotic-like serine/threonine-protein kinase
VNALPWADVWLDGRHIGETPLANVKASAGAHELLLRHPELGEVRQSVVVKSGQPTRVTVSMKK